MNLATAFDVSDGCPTQTQLTYLPHLETVLCTARSQLSPCGHLAINDTSTIRTAAKSPAKMEYRHLTEINCRYYGLLLLSQYGH